MTIDDNKNCILSRAQFYPPTHPIYPRTDFSVQKVKSLIEYSLVVV